MSTTTEQEWLGSTDPATMLDHLLAKGSDRKHRLFACACCRHIWHLMPDVSLRAAVGIAEQYADGRATQDELTAAWEAAWIGWVVRNAARNAAWAAIWATASGIVRDAARNAARSAAWAAARAAARNVNNAAWGTREVAGVAEAKAQADLLRDIFGNPWRPIMCCPIGYVDDTGECIYGDGIDPAWLAWNDGMIPSLAQAIYYRRDFSDMPILCDALEEAGCNNADILSHCRQTGEHVRGCWVVDLILGKN